MRQARDRQRESIALSGSNPGKSVANIFRHRSSSKRGHELPPLLNDNKVFLIDDTDKAELFSAFFAKHLATDSDLVPFVRSLSDRSLSTIDVSSDLIKKHITSDQANITGVAAPVPGKLEVRWVNPSNPNVEIFSSKAVARPKDGGSEITCDGTTEAETRCSLDSLRNFTEYEFWVEVCTAPAKVEVVGDVPGGGCTNISAKTKWTIPIAPDPANITAVAAPAAGTLEVRWVNPSKANGNLSSSRAIARPKNGGSYETCNGTAEALSATKCSLNGLRNFTEYEVWVEVCTAPAKVEVVGDVPGGGCTNISAKTKWTIPIAPDPANITAVAAPAAGTLEVRWVNPSKANGNLSSSRAIARPKNGGSYETCNGTAEALSATKCSLNGLRNFTEYEVWVEVCTAPAKVEVVGDVPGGGCTNISAKTKWTIPIAPDPANITAVAAPAAGTLEVRWVNPSKANGNLSSSRAIARPKNGGSYETCNGTAEALSATKCSLNGLRNFTEYEVWVEVCTASAKVEVVGDVPGGGCTNISAKTKWTIPIAPDPANITAVAAPAAGTLEVRWVNPSKANGNLSSSRAIARPKNGGSYETCNATAEALSATKCSLNGLRNFTEYEFWVEVCTTPAKVEVVGDVPGGGCTNISAKTKWTIPIAPDPANITAVAAPAAGTLEVRWVNPSKANGNLSSSRAIARPKNGGSNETCNGTAEALSATKCSLNGLRNFTEYEVWVEVCTAPAKVEVVGDVPGGGCTNISAKTKWTIPIAPDPANITAVAAPAAGTLEVRWVNPSKANGNLSSSRAIARPKNGGSYETCNATAEALSAAKCSLNGLRNFTEYEFWVEVCTAPAKVEVVGDVPGGGCTNISAKTKWTIPIAPDPANITAVAAPAAGTLEVRWVNPSKANGNLSSSRAIARPKNGGSNETCNGTAEALSATKCSLNGLRNFTEYEVWVEVCTAPAKVEVVGDVPGGGCTNISAKTKWTIPIAPDPANITAVAAPAAGTLEVRWVNPSKANGNLSSSRAIARPKNGGSYETCNGTAEALSATKCSLNGLRNFTEYEFWVEVCTAPAKVEVVGDVPGGGCTNISAKTKWTIPIAPDPANITAVAAPAAGTLEVRWVNPSKANGNLSSSRAIARPKNGGSNETCNGTAEALSATKCSLNGLRNFTEYEVWVEVCTAPAKVEVVGDVPGGGCTNISAKTKWTIPIAPDPANITAVAAPAAGTLEVRWVNPSKANGNLSSSRAIARPKNGGSYETCNATAEALSAAKCSLNGLRNFTEYEFWVEVCTAPAKVEVVGDVPGGGCTNISAKTKWTIPIAPDQAVLTAVDAPVAGTLEVRWVNPSKANGNLSSSRAIARPKNGGSNETCNGTAEALSATKCSLNGLRNFTEYEVWVEVCTAPAKVEVVGDVPGGGCTNISAKTKWTIPIAPDPANITAVAAPAAGTLEVRWVNPSKANGNLSSSRAIARPKNGGSNETCNGTAEALSATKCSLNGLRNFTEYEVWVEVCTAPAKVEVVGDVPGGGCTNISAKTKWTIPIAPDPANITAVAAPAAGTLEVRWVNPSKANGNLSSSRAIARPKNGGSNETCNGTAEALSATECSVRCLRNFAEYDVWVEVCTAPAKVEVVGDVPGGFCTNSALAEKWTITAAPDQAVLTAVDAPAAAHIGTEAVGPSTGLIVGVTFACLVVLAVVLFVVFWMRRRRTASPPLAKPEDFNFDPRKSNADIEPQYHSQTQYELESQQDGVYEMEDEVDVGGPKMNVYVDMPSLSYLKTNMPSQQPPPLPPRTPEEVYHPACMNLPGSTDALAKVTAPNVSLSSNRLENAVMREGAGDVPQGQPQASAVTLAGEKPVLPPRPLSD
ncbi:Fibronectin type 3 domain [Sparganum proliferum]